MVSAQDEKLSNYITSKIQSQENNRAISECVYPLAIATLNAKSAMTRLTGVKIHFSDETTD